MNNTSEVQTTNPVSQATVKVVKGRLIFNFTIADSWGKELTIFQEVVKANRQKKVSFSQLIDEAIKLRTNPKFDLVAFNKLTLKTQKNFVNRLARYLGGTFESGEKRNSKQAVYFNIEVQSGLTCSFSTPINIDYNLSPQVKAEGQSITLPRRTLTRLTSDISVKDIKSSKK